MNWLLLALGLILLVLVSIDILTTIIQTQGGGLISTRASDKLWQLLFYLAGKNGRSKFLRYSGLLIIMLLLTSWIIMLWLSYSLIFIAFPDSVLHTSTGEPANLWQHVYYVGYTITSLGPGTFQAGNDFWRIITNLMGITGTIFLTLAISYIIPVLSAVTKMRTLAKFIHQLGDSPTEILRKHYKNNSFDHLYSDLKELQLRIIEHGERHLAYPVLHYFHSTSPVYAVTVNMARLDELLNLLEIYEFEDISKHHYEERLRSSITSYLNSIGQTSIPDKGDPPHWSYGEELKDILNEKSQKTLPDEEMQKRRGLFLNLLRNDGWEWKDIFHTKD